jgi:hypothetical protein
MAKLFALLAVLLACLACLSSCRAASFATDLASYADEDITTLESSGRELTGLNTDEDDTLDIPTLESDFEPLEPAERKLRTEHYDYKDHKKAAKKAKKFYKKVRTFLLHFLSMSTSAIATSNRHL